MTDNRTDPLIEGPPAESKKTKITNYYAIFIDGFDDLKKHFEQMEAKNKTFMRVIWKGDVYDISPDEFEGFLLMRKVFKKEADIKRKPSSPGEILLKEYLEPMGLTPKLFADSIGYDVEIIQGLIDGEVRIDGRLAIDLSCALKTTPKFWLNAQEAYKQYNEEEYYKSLDNCP